MKKTLNHLAKIITAFFLFTIFMIFSAFWYFSSGLPDYKKLANYEPPVSSRVYGDSGELISRICNPKKAFYTNRVYS